MRNNLSMHIYEWKNKNFQNSLPNLFFFLNRVPNISLNLFEFFFSGKKAKELATSPLFAIFFSEEIKKKTLKLLRLEIK